MLKKIGRKLLLSPFAKKVLAPVVSFYENQPVYPGDGLFRKTDGPRPLFHVGNVMPMNDKDIAALAALASKAQPLTAIEVGSWTGRSTSVIAGEVKKNNGIMFAVDHWQGNEDKNYTGSMQYDILSIFRHNMRACGVGDKVFPLVMPSLVAAEFVPDEWADMIFIDADHRYTPVLNDIMAWLPKVRRGGIICGHDCSGYYTNQEEAIKEIIKENCEQDDNKVFGHPGVSLALYKAFSDNYSIMPGSNIWWKKIY